VRAYGPQEQKEARDTLAPYTGRFFRRKSGQVENMNKTCYAP